MSNTPLVMIPGLACTEALFADQVAVLAQGREVIIGDHMRHDNMADIAAHILAAAPERVERLALLDTSARADTHEKTVQRREALELVAAGKYMAVCRSTLDLSIAESRHGDATLKAAIIDMAVDSGADVWAMQTRAIIGRADSVPMLGAISCPTLVVVGDEDQLTPMDCAVEMVDGIANARLQVLADCGHMSAMERPDVITGLLQEWLAN